MIHIRNISKVFKIPHAKKKTLYHNILSMIKGQYDYEEFYALKNISFDVLAGEFLGIIGRNGSGKSTLLKILSRIYQPTSGELEINDEVYPLLELGVGFQPDFSVKENIYILGSLLGFTRKEMNIKLDEILHFSELKRFVDTELDKLSTGMQVRLGFSIAIQSHAPIILVDEVLAVGDQIFSEKCRKVFREFKQEGRTIVLVTHDLVAVREYCDRVFVMDQGQLIDQGAPEEMISLYENKILQLN